MQITIKQIDNGYILESHWGKRFASSKEEIINDINNIFKAEEDLINKMFGRKKETSNQDQLTSTEE